MRPNSLVGYLLGVCLAVIFFEIYGAVTKPTVSRPVQIVVDQLGYGVPIGDRVKSIGARFDVTPRFVPHLGYTFNVGVAKSGWPKRAQVWLLLDEKAREKKNPVSARVNAFEILTAEPTAPYTFAGNISSVFGVAPTRGCISMTDGRYREVSYWVTKNDRGGVAVLTDYNPASQDGSRPPGGATAMLVFAGRFDSSRTLRGDYMPWPCRTVSKIDHAEHAPSAAEEALLAYAERAVPAPSPIPHDQLPEHQDALTDACAYPPAAGEGWHEVRAGELHVSLPPRFPEVSSGGPNRPYYHWTQGGGTADIEIRPVHSENDIGVDGTVAGSCSWEDGRGQVTVRVGEKSHVYGELFVTAYFVVGGKPSFTIVATTHDSKTQVDLLHAVRTATDSPIWSIEPPPPTPHWKVEPRS